MSAPPSNSLFGERVGTTAPGRDFRVIRDGPQFVELKRRTLRFVVPATALFMGNYLLFVLLSAYAPGLMATPVLGAINLGIAVGVFQFLTTMTVVVAYSRYARQHTDPLAEALRDEVEGRNEVEGAGR